MESHLCHQSPSKASKIPEASSPQLVLPATSTTSTGSPRRSTRKKCTHKHWKSMYTNIVKHILRLLVLQGNASLLQVYKHYILTTSIHKPALTPPQVHKHSQARLNPTKSPQALTSPRQPHHKSTSTHTLTTSPAGAGSSTGCSARQRAGSPRCLDNTRAIKEICRMRNTDPALLHTPGPSPQAAPPTPGCPSHSTALCGGWDATPVNPSNA